MIASRGMGAVNPNKLPKAKVVKMAEGDLVDEAKVKPNYAVINPDFKAAGARFSAKKALGKDSDIEGYMDVNAMKAKDRDFQAKVGKVGVVYNKRFAKGGKVAYAGGGLYANIAAKKKRIASGSGEKMRSAGAAGAPKKSDFANAAKTASYKEGGSTVNAAGNYTKPELRKRIFNAVKAEATAGTAAGQWSARKAQMVAQRYKKAGGGYRD